MSLIIDEAQSINVNGLNNAVLIRYSEANSDNTVATQIANYTVQTWQQNRGRQETLNNTLQGKVAEELFQLFVSQNYPEIGMLSYDDIRNDDFRKSAPFDFLTWANPCNLDRIARAIQKDIDHSRFYVNLSQDARILCQNENVKIVEVKSTKIIDRHKRQCSFNRGDYNDLLKVGSLVRAILNDDFLTYPHLCRTTSITDYSVDDYIDFLQSRNVNVHNEEEMLQYELANQVADAFVRVYIDEEAHIGLLMGWIDKERFYNSATFKRMPQWGKSELALYFATSLRNGKTIDCFPTLFNI